MEFTAEEMKALLHSVIQEELKPITERLDQMESQLSAINENTEITRTAVNSLIEWADQVSVITQIKFPVARKKA